MESWITPSEQSRPFFDGADQGVLRLQYCGDCGAWMYPLKSRCQRCGSANMDWRDASGAGILYAHAMLQRQYHSRHEGRLPMVIAWVDLPEGVRVPTNVVGTEPAKLKAGMPLTVDFERDPAGTAFPVFRVAG